jgi:hypothetical protein
VTDNVQQNIEDVAHYCTADDMIQSRQNGAITTGSYVDGDVRQNVTEATDTCVADVICPSRVEKLQNVA